MKKLDDLCLATKLYVLLGIFLAGFGIFGAVFMHTLDTLRVQGPLYNRISQAKDLVADILPPPEYIIEPYLLLHQAYESETDADIWDIQGRFSRLRASFEERHAFWDRSLSMAELRESLVVDAYLPAVDVFDLAESAFFPALLAHDKSQAQRLLTGDIRTKYEAHRTVIDHLVKLASQSVSANEANGAELVRFRILLVVGLALGIILVAAVVCVLIIRGILRQLGADPVLLKQIAECLASGDLTLQRERIH